MIDKLDKNQISVEGLKIICQIGHGGMSVVYLAKQHSPERQVAVKVMRQQTNTHEQDLQRFTNEANTIAKLNHPNIITIHKTGTTTTGERYFTMPYLNHGDFSSFQYTDDESFIRLLHAICDGLKFAHQKGIIHRDIKPENLLFDEGGHIKIADFGVAQSQNNGNLTEEHHIIGSAKYMSPEQTRSSKVDERTDIYSLGIVIYEKLTGKVPFDSGDSISILVDQVSKTPEPLPHKFRHWQPFMDRCLAKSPDDRFGDILEVKQALTTLNKGRSRAFISPLWLPKLKKTIKLPAFKWGFSLLALVILVTILFNRQYPQNDFVEIDNGIDNITVEETQLVNEAPKDPTLAINQTPEEPLSPASQLLTTAYEGINDTIFLAPENNQVTTQFLEVLSLSPDNQEAIKGLKYIEDKYTELINLSISQANHKTALQLARSLERFNTQTRDVTGQANLQRSSIAQTIKDLIEQPTSLTAIQARNLSKVLITLGIKQSLNTLNNITNKQLNAQIGERFFNYKAVHNTPFADSNLAVSDEITVEEYRAFSEATNRVAVKCVHQTSFFGRIKKIGRLVSSRNWKKTNFEQTEQHPVVCVNINDAKSYALWLSELTGNRYRLLTQQEWLFLANSENNDFTPCQTANHAGKNSKKVRNGDSKYNCDDGFIYSAPVGHFGFNKLGFSDVHGNVSEWIECNTEPCTTATAMGTSWQDGQTIRINERLQQHKSTEAFSHIGFRLVREVVE